MYGSSTFNDTLFGDLYILLIFIIIFYLLIDNVQICLIIFIYYLLLALFIIIDSYIYIKMPMKLPMAVLDECVGHKVWIVMKGKR